MAWTLKHLFSRKPDPVEPDPVQPDAVQTDADTWFERGNSHVSQQQWQAALDCYREAARRNPNHAHAHAYIGNVLRQLRRADEALVAYDRAIAAKPDFAEAHYNRGAILQQARQARAALESYEAALAINSAFVEAHCSRGDVLQELGRLDEALSSYTAAITTHGGFAKAYLHRGVLRQQLHQLDAAEADYKQAIALRPDYADAHFSLASLLSNAGHTTAALRSFDTAIQLRPNFAAAFSNRARAQAKAGMLVEARASHDNAVSLNPQDAEIHFNRGCFLSDLKEWNDAIESYQAATRLRPDYADAYCNLGHAQQEAGQTDAALTSYERALEINPRLSIAFNNRGNLFRLRHQFEQALPQYRQAIALEPDSVEAHYNLAQLALLTGDFATGWAEYEWRRLIEEARTVPARQLPQPVWRGDQPLQGKRIFLHAEQGLGDTIQFCRYVSLVASLGAHVALEVPERLGDLLANLDGVSELVLAGAPVPPADYQCSLMSLPGAFKTTLQTIPTQVPYLRADADKVAQWRALLGSPTRPRVGLAWSGNPRNRNDHHRSVKLAQWTQLLPDECAYFCLQKEIHAEDRRIMESSGKITLVETASYDFPHTAALIETLDLVISVDTSLAHLSGALGRPTWILLPYLPDWRWLVGRRDTPWYPTATLYRQPAAGDWHSVLTEVRDQLRQLPRPQS